MNVISQSIIIDAVEIPLDASEISIFYWKSAIPAREIANAYGLSSDKKLCNMICVAWLKNNNCIKCGGKIFVHNRTEAMSVIGGFESNYKKNKMCVDCKELLEKEKWKKLVAVPVHTNVVSLPKIENRQDKDGYRPSQNEIDEFYDSWEWKTLSYNTKIYYGRTCKCCGASPETGAVIHTDHIKPIRLF